jgi:hypothetical protein
MLATIGRYFDPWEAHVLKARLQAEGIPASVAGDQHIIANWPLSVALGGPALQVPVPYAAQALAVLASYEAGTFEQELAAQHPEATDACPRCGCVELLATVSVGQRLLSLLTYLVASAPFSTRANRLQCDSCGQRLRYDG